MNAAQKEFLQGLARDAFEAQGGFLPAVQPQAQLDTAARMAAKIMASRALTSRTVSPHEAVDRAVTRIRSGRMAVDPKARTVAQCQCGHPGVPHMASFHGK